MTSFVLLVGLAAIAQDGAHDPKKIEHTLKKDAQEAAVITVTSSGDMILFDGALTVPAQRPSVEECGIWMSKSPKERPKELAALKRKAERESHSRPMSARERHTYVTKALAPKRACQGQFLKKCKEIKERITVDVRKSAIDHARKSIKALLAEAKLKSSIEASLKNVLAACSLEE